jgi:hypothetical protein
MKKYLLHVRLLEVADDVFEEGAYEVALIMREAANELLRLRQVTTEQCATVTAIAGNNRQLSHEVARLRCVIGELQGIPRNTSQH